MAMDVDLVMLRYLLSIAKEKLASMQSNTQMVCLSGLLQSPLEGETSQFTQLLSNLSFLMATFALIAAASLGCNNHALPEPTLRSLTKPNGTSGRSALQVVEI